MSLAIIVRIGLVSSLAFIWLSVSIYRYSLDGVDHHDVARLGNSHSRTPNRGEPEVESSRAITLETPVQYKAGKALPHFTADLCDRFAESVGVLYSSTQRAFHGTAFSLGADPRDSTRHLFLTAAHCVEGRQPPFVIGTRLNQDETWQWHTATVLDVDSVRDLALLSVPDVRDCRGLRVATTPDAAKTGTGDRVLIHGYPRRTFTLYETRVVDLGRIEVGDDRYTSVVIDGPVAGGQSGSPVLNQAGRVIGVVARGNDEYGVCVHAGEIRIFLEQAGLHYLCNLPESLGN